jgi:hypothetical protein
MIGPLGGIDPGLLGRFRAAGVQIQWRDAPPAGRSKKSAATALPQIAHLNDEEARVDRRAAEQWFVDAGPLGALVLLLEIDRRALPVQLVSREAGEVPGFDQGAIEARWGPPSEGAPVGPTMKDLIGLARYALA